MLRVSNKANKVTQTHGVSYIQDRYIDIRRCIHIHYITHIHILCKHIYIYRERERESICESLRSHARRSWVSFWFSVLFLVSFAFRVRNRSHMEAIDRSWVLHITVTVVCCPWLVVVVVLVAASAVVVGVINNLRRWLTNDDGAAVGSPPSLTKLHAFTQSTRKGDGGEGRYMTEGSPPRGFVNKTNCQVFATLAQSARPIANAKITVCTRI